MTDHLPECPLSGTCENNEEHDPLDMPDWCQVCDQRCICDRLEKCKKRTLDEGYSVGYGAAMEDGWGQPKNMKAAINVALDAARAAIEAIPDGYKIRGEFESYSAYHEGRSDFKDGALAAINALREKP